ncbi:MAG TPA: integrase arm-type DNA-binding domain-containing protein [Spongiibacteraceae bacterium]|jgi:integrase
MSLTDLTVRLVKPKDKDFKLADANGLFLLVKKTGAKYWRFKYRYLGAEKLLALGVYPEVKLSEARRKVDDARKQLREGIDPSELRKVTKSSKMETAANSFQAVGLEWFAKQSRLWSEKHAAKTRWMLEKNLFPWLGSRPISIITPPELLATLRRIESRGAYDTANRVKQVSGQVFRYAVATGRAERDPSQDLRGALTASVTTHLAAITDPKAVGPLLNALDAYQGTPIVRAALRLAPLTFVRPGELRQALWSEIDLDIAEWRIPSERMKSRQAHIVPLSKQAVEILRELYPLTGPEGYLFPSPRTTKRPMSDSAVLAALRRMGIAKEEMSGHGFRAMARTILDEVLNYRVDWIEHQLAHAVRDVNGRAYNRTAHLEGRRKMMQGWADYLDTLRLQASGGNVIPIQQKHVETQQ